jgi:hypothetical protein
VETVEPETGVRAMRRTFSASASTRSPRSIAGRTGGFDAKRGFGWGRAALEQHSELVAKQRNLTPEDVRARAGSIKSRKAGVGTARGVSERHGIPLKKHDVARMCSKPKSPSARGAARRAALRNYSYAHAAEQDPGPPNAAHLDSCNRWLCRER